MQNAFVFIAGIDGTVDLFEPFVPRLEKLGWRVLLYEHTHLNRWNHCDSVEHFADEVRDLLDREQVGRAVICGESFGGTIAMTFARKYPQRMRALVLLASFAHLPFSGRAWLSRQLGRQLTSIASFLPSALVRISRRIYNPSGGRHEPLEFRRMLRKKRTADLAVYTFKSCLALGFDARDWLQNLSAPAFVLTGEKDRLIPTDCSREIARLLPNADLVTIPGSGHLSHYAHPEMFWPPFEAFLKRVQAQSAQVG